MSAPPPAPALVLEPTPRASGSQGSVYYATSARGRPVAVKVAAASDDAQACLAWEVEVLTALRAANAEGVVELLGTATVGGRPALVMPRYPDHLGTWCASVRAQPGQGSLVEVLARMAEVATVLAGVHRVRVRGGTLVHRDVKPENLLVDGHGRVRLADFGGALAIDGLHRVEHVLFGTPMWAPLEQILPARAIPDPTWDTHAVCAMLFALLTGSRPAWHADPTPLLTPGGRALWEAAGRLIAGDRSEEAARSFARLRAGTTAEDLLDLTGAAALTDYDHTRLGAGVAQLAALAHLDAETTTRVADALWAVLVRGLSPLAHPSPPNRYRDASELAAALHGVIALLSGRDSSLDEPVDWLAIDRPVLDVDLPTRSVRAGLPPGLGVGAVLLCLASAAGAVTWWSTLPQPTDAVIGPARVAVDGRYVDVARFRIDRAEVDHGAWAACATAGACPPRGAPSPAPVAASFAEAAAYCAFVGGRLPTEAEWVAAAGPRVWPWGDEPATCAHAIGLGCDGPRAVDTPTLGVSTAGVRDLAGNLAEWVVSAEGSPVLRGGSFRSPASAVGRRGRELSVDGASDDTTGLRCARDGVAGGR